MKRTLVLALALLPALALAQAKKRPGGGGGGILANCPSCNLVDATLTTKAIDGAHAIIMTDGSYLCLDPGCNFYLRRDTGNGPVQLGGQLIVMGSLERVGGAGDLQIEMDGASTGNPVAIKAVGVDSTIPINILPKGGAPLTQAGLKMPVLAGAATAQQAVVMGTQALTAGAATVTFATPFSATPVICLCDDASSVLAAKCPATASALTITVTGGTTDNVNYICIGPL